MYVWTNSFLTLEPPVFAKNVAVVPGSTFSLSCAAAGSPRPRIEWLRAMIQRLLFKKAVGFLYITQVMGNNDKKHQMSCLYL